MDDLEPGQTPSVAVVGPGAIGTTIAALVYAEGHSVLVCGRTARASSELRPDNGAPIVVPESVCTNPADVAGPIDIVLLAVKDTQTALPPGGWPSCATSAPSCARCRTASNNANG